MFSASARAEVKNAAAYYESEVDGLGRAFLQRLEVAILEIQEFPSASRQIRGDFRRHLLSRFPFGVIYRVHDEKIFIATVMHLKRHPEAWMDSHPD